MRSHLWLVLPILGFSLLLHFIWLSHPNEVVFDEVHWGKFVTSYCCSSQNFFDVHPPHGKLLVAGVSKFFGYQGDQDFALIGNPYLKISPLVFRWLPALAGAIVPIVVYFLLLQLGASTRLAFLGGWMMAFENGLLNQSKLMGLYPFLLLSLVSAFYFLTKLEGSKGLQNCIYCVLAGIASGFALGFQFTGLVALGLIFLVLGIKLLQKKINLGDFFAQGAVIFTSALCVYLAGWCLHFYLLTLPGPGDLFYHNTGNFWTDIIALHRIMYSASYHLTTHHPDASLWWSWPYMGKPIYYWTKAGSAIYFLGNPLVWWGISLGLVLLILRSMGNWSKPFLNSKGAMALAGFFIAFLPLTGMHRVLFLYHYLTPLTYALLFVLSQLPHHWFNNNKMYYGLIALVVMAFLWISPLTYGFYMPSWYWNTLPWKLAH